MLCGLAAASFSLAASQNQSRDSPKSRLDFLQTILLFVTIALPLFALNLGGDVLPWSHPAVIVLFSCTPIAFGGLILVTTNRSANASTIKRLLEHSAVLALFATTFFVVYAFNAVCYFFFPVDSFGVLPLTRNSLPITWPYTSRLDRSTIHPHLATGHCHASFYRDLSELS